LLAITNAVETAGHLRKFQANHGEGRARTGELIVKADRHRVRPGRLQA
jgi:hypothetical protein